MDGLMKNKITKFLSFAEDIKSILIPIYLIWFKFYVDYLMVDNNSKGILDHFVDIPIGIREFVKKYLLSKGIILSNSAYNSLFIGLILFFESWVVRYHPDEWWWTPFLFIGFFVIEFLNKIFLEQVDRKIQKLKDKSMPYAEIAPNISIIAVKKPQEIIEILKDYIEDKFLDENIQISLFKRYDEYTLELRAYINQEIILKEFITPKSIGVFLLASTLSDEFLEKLVNVYGKSNLFWFNLGRTHKKYNLREEPNEKNYYTAGYYFKEFYDRLITKLSWIRIVLSFIIVGLVIVFDPSRNMPFEPIGYILFLFLVFVLFSPISQAIESNQIKKKVRLLLKEKGLKLDDIEFEFINQLDI